MIGNWSTRRYGDTHKYPPEIATLQYFPASLPKFILTFRGDRNHVVERDATPVYFPP